MGISRTRPTQWLKDNWRALPSMGALLGVSIFWIVGAVGGIDFLRDASSAMVMLTGLYMMLVAVAASIIIAVLALTDLIQRYGSRTRP